MKLQEGHQYKLVDLEVRQGLPGADPRFRVYSLHGYNGGVIVYGEKLSHQQHVYRVGFETIPERSGAFVYLPNEIPVNVNILSAALRGRPIAIQDDQGDARLPIVNWAARLGTLWWTDGLTHSQGELLRRGAIAIDLYHEWKSRGYFPAWFVQARKVPDLVLR